MSKNKKKKKAQRQVDPRVLQDIGLGFKTLFSNDACIKAAREWKGVRNVIPVVVALASVVVALVPYFVQQNKAQGSTIVLASPTGNYELGLASMVHSLAYDSNDVARSEPITLTVDANGKLSFKDETADFRTNGTGAERWYTLTRMEEDKDGDMQTRRVFEAFFNDSASVDDVTFFTRLDKNENPYTGETRTMQVGTENTVYQCSYIAFGKESVRFRRRNELTVANGLTGSYEALKGMSITDLAKSEALAGVQTIDQKYIDDVKTYFTDFINKSFEPAKKSALWMYTGIFFGVDAGAIILFGFMLFLMTRGKRNPFRIYTFWETQKMAYWASFTPALLSLIGFAIPNMAFIMFFFIYGFRMMWMSMKSMRAPA